MNLKDILAIVTLGVISDSGVTKKRKEKKKENIDCCPKCGSHCIQMKKGDKFRCLDCGKVSYCAREIWE